MEKQGWVSVWLGNTKEGDSISEYVDLTYDEVGESVTSKFFIDFSIDMDEIDEDTIEKVVYGKSSSDIHILLEGCSYEEVVIPKIKKESDLKKPYNTVILIYNFKYSNEINYTRYFDFIGSVEYE
ncbi:immunity 22 family protein [Salipaludibacillus sp. LMS25]|jgi:hypothetical protein|uniref:immunity 22 family protein n=1 Tax=Salipaludibacillus sp. LMS25 TaxID=2924031 RepID=UPI0020D0FDC2|nr:immunity 22 family protein [Salipaludibacillus sp. LMS25]UTR16757.1 immunity 22 family protein [Salipaludibacillus sp. LMS25]